MGYTIGYPVVVIIIERAILLMVTGGNKETNMVAMVAAKANSVKRHLIAIRISHVKQRRKGKVLHRVLLAR